MSDYPRFDLLSGEGHHIIIVKLRDYEEWIPYCEVVFDYGDADPTGHLIRYLNATGYNPLRDAE